MPPKIASLVKFFEERQQLEEQQAALEQERSFTRAQSHSPAAASRSVSSSNTASSSRLPILPPPTAQRRRVSAPVLVAAEPSRAHPARAGRSDDVSSPRDATTAGDTSTPNTTDRQATAFNALAKTPISPSSHPAAIKPKAMPVAPLESKDNATKVEGKKAGQLIIDKLIATSTPKKDDSPSPSSPSKSPNSASPIPIKERFKQRHHLLAPDSNARSSSSSPPTAPTSPQSNPRNSPSQRQSPESHELQSVRRPSLPVYPGSVTSLATLVEEPRDTANSQRSPDSRTEERLPLYANDAQAKESLTPSKLDEKRHELHDYLDRPNSSFSSIKTLVGPSNTPSSKDKVDDSSCSLNNEDSSYQHETSLRPSLPTSQSATTQLSSITTDIPAFQVFAAADAKPLELPLLDEYIANLPLVTFSSPEKVMSDSELKGWNEWIAQAGDEEKKRKENVWRRYLGLLMRRWRSGCKATDTSDVDADGIGDNGNDGDNKLPHALRNNLNAEQARRALIFPPMHRLPPNLTVTDLKYNRSKKAPLVSLNVLLSTAIDAVLGAEGSTYAVSLIRVEAFRDLIQIIGSVTDFAKPRAVSSTAASISTLSANSTISDSLNPFLNATITPFDRTSPKYVILTVVPSILGLDFVSAFGKAILWLWVFTLICFIACWEFRVMAREVGSTGTRKGGRVGHDAQAGHFSEGLDCEDVYNNSRTRSSTTTPTVKKGFGPGGIPGWNWFSRLRRSRGYRITVIFLVTSLYLPLSKISIGALAWTSDYWAVENYYIYHDDPTPSPLGPKEQYRDPLDFCYTTTMRKQGWNWAPPILIVSSLTVLIITIWFPIRLWFVVSSQVPKVDNFTELGEKRRDLKAEYNRLLERDQSPFSFIYNEYRKPWAGFKSAYMALKLINVLCITLLTKVSSRISSRK